MYPSCKAVKQFIVNLGLVSVGLVFMPTSAFQFFVMVCVLIAANQKIAFTAMTAVGFSSLQGVCVVHILLSKGFPMSLLLWCLVICLIPI